MKIEIKRTSNSKWYFRILAGNHKTLCHSENYKTKRSAQQAVQLIVDGARNADVTEHP